ncbi:protein-disulfide reductase DsbD family protein [Microbulbifer aggregans]|uniref:protein-disulfide reductase DsbD family protein n=1 Tax=Microbulbifer aggregans TaxID=1769779 RepID=UPI0008595686|nr:thioredoxin family protein [Microbulbifer aggregans]
MLLQKNIVKAILALVLLSATTFLVAQESASGDHVRVRWLAPETFAAGEPATIGFYFEVDPEWHVYWRNAGDSGAAPRFDLSVTGAHAGDILWPVPKRLPIEHLTNLGYEGNVAYLLPLTPEQDAGQVVLEANLEWLVCKIDCIPGFGTMRLERPVMASQAWDASDRDLVAGFLARVPKRQADSPWRATALLEEGEEVVLTLQGAGETPEVFPLDGALLTAAEPEVQRRDDSIVFRFQRVPGAAPAQSAGFVVSDGAQAWSLEQVPFGLRGESPAQSLWLLVLAAFAGGVILNLMPCVFPVLSIKVFGLINSGAGHRMREALLYGAGVLATFAALGALLLALRAGGAAVGWGFQLQSAPVVLALIALFWLMALSFSGLFEFGHRLMNLAGSSRGGSFATGVLAVFVAAPCTGPFMGAALGAAAVLPALSAMAIFLALGVGLAAPFLLLCASPPLLRRLPQPGPWMDKLRQFLAFPLYLTVIWLLWVLGRLLGEDGWLIGSLLLVALVFAIWLGGTIKRGGRAVGYLFSAIALVMAFSALQLREGKVSVAGEGAWQPFEPAAIAAAREEGRGVFIDYTAAWCITCQVNKKLVLDLPEIQEIFQRNNVYLVRADWTDHNPEITRALAALGRNSVPVYAWYAPGTSRPELLPQILQESMITGLFEDSPSQSKEDDTQ